MKLVSSEFHIYTEIRENHVLYLVVENPSMLVKISEDLIKQSEGQEGEILLLDPQGHEEKLSKIGSVISDIFSLTLNSKKILAKLYEEMEKEGERLLEQKETLNTGIVNLLEGYSFNVPYQNITFNLELQIADLFKLYNVKFEEVTRSLAEKLIEFIKISSRL